MCACQYGVAEEGFSKGGGDCALDADIGWEEGVDLWGGDADAFLNVKDGGTGMGTGLGREQVEVRLGVGLRVVRGEEGEKGCFAGACGGARRLVW